MTFKIFERTDKYTQENIPLIFIISPGGKKVPTGYSCKRGSWNQESQSIQTTGANKDPKAPQLNAKLKRASIALQDIIDKTKDIQEIRKEYKKYLQEINGEVVIEQPVVIDLPILNDKRFKKRFDKFTPAGQEFCLLIEGLINSHSSDWSDPYKIRFRTLTFKMLEYEPNLRIDMITETWWRSFVTFCIEKKKNVSNTISTNAGSIAIMVREFGEDKKIADKISWNYIEPEVLPISWDKVLKIQSINLESHPGYTIRDSRKLWLASAFTGRRRGEVFEMGPHNFYERDGRWRYKNIGKGMKLIDIKLLPEAVEFFKSINFTLPKLHGPTVNKDIKLICRECGFDDKVLMIIPIDANNVRKEVVEEWRTVHFHTARHSYAHHIVELSAGRPHAEKFVSHMLGHASHKTTWKYMNRSASSNEQFFDELFPILGSDLQEEEKEN